jgi:hypothetical protein
MSSSLASSSTPNTRQASTSVRGTLDGGSEMPVPRAHAGLFSFCPSSCPSHTATFPLGQRSEGAGELDLYQR